MAHLDDSLVGVASAARDRLDRAVAAERATRHRPAGDKVRDDAVEELRYARAVDAEFYDRP